MKTPITVPKNATIYDAADAILDFDISGVIVESEQPSHISQKGISQALLSEKQNIKEIPVMNYARELRLVDKFAPLSNCADLMLKLKINALGVTDEHNFVGIITKHNLVKYFEKTMVDETKLSDIMSVGSFFVSENSTIFDALSKMLENGISRILVTDDSTKPVGIATYKNFLKTTVYHANQSKDAVFSSGFGNEYKIGQVCTKNIISVSVNASIAQVARVMIEYRVHGVAVTQKQRIAGFVTEKDIVRQLAKMA